MGAMWLVPYSVRSSPKTAASASSVLEGIVSLLYGESHTRLGGFPSLVAEKYLLVVSALPWCSNNTINLSILVTLRSIRGLLEAYEPA